jgi:hypothetical protein
MRGGMIVNGLVVAAALIGTVQFVSGRSEGAFTGRDEAEWRLVAAAEDGPRLYAKHCQDRACELRLLLPRDQWLALDTACFEGEQTACFNGRRIDFQAAVPPARPRAILLRNRDGSTRRLPFALTQPG